MCACLGCGVLSIVCSNILRSLLLVQVFFKRSTIYIPFIMVGAYFANEVSGWPRRPGEGKACHLLPTASPYFQSPKR